VFQPAIPADGLLGWRLLQRTYDTQFEAFSRSPMQKRDTEYFRENIAKVKTAEDLVSDRRLLSVALGAFGLQDDINNKYFIKKILEEGTVADDALSNRFADKRYKELSKAFGFGPAEIQRNRLTDFPDDIIAKFERQSFEVAVGEQSQTLRIALAAERSFEDMANSDSSEKTKWFEVMSQPPLRKLFETAFNLPTSFAQIDIDKQQELLSDYSKKLYGTSDPADFADPQLQEKLLTRFTALSQLRETSTSFSSNASALTLLRGF
jgi:hypothetical protein